MYFVTTMSCYFLDNTTANEVIACIFCILVNVLQKQQNFVATFFADW